MMKSLSAGAKIEEAKIKENLQYFFFFKYQERKFSMLKTHNGRKKINELNCF